MTAVLKLPVTEPVGRLTMARLAMRNFKGVRELEVVPDGHDFAVFGDNGTGKTTIADAVYWLLFGKDSHNRKDFEIKTIDPETGQSVRNLTHEVEADFDLPSGGNVTLRRVYREVWTNKRGAPVAEFSGHTTDYFVNSVPVQEKEYVARIADVCREDVFRMLTDPNYFNGEMKWQDRRRILLEVCGDVTDQDVVDSDPELAELPSIVGSRSIDEYRKIVVAKTREVNDQLKALPHRIDEAKRALSVAESAVKSDPAKLEALRDRLRTLNEERATIVAGGSAADARIRLQETIGEIAEISNRIKAEREAVLAGVTEALRKAEAELRSEEDLARSADRNVQDVASRIRTLTDRRELLVADWKHEDAKTLALDVAETCPSCLQPLPAEKVEAAKAKAVEDFNVRKSAALKRINDEGQEVRRNLDAATEAEASFVEKRRKHEDRSAELKTEVDRLRKELQEKESAAPVLLADADYVAAADLKRLIEKEIEDQGEGTREAVAAKDAEIRLVSEEIASFERSAAAAAQADEQRTRLQKLGDDQKAAAQESEKLLRHLYLTDRFVRSKVKLLTDRINGRFSLTKFRLFNDLVNGGVEETCEATDFDGVPFSSLNHGKRLNVGLDVIDTLAEHYGFAPLVVIDNAESVTSIRPTIGQQARLIVSATDPALRVETRTKD